MRGSGARRTWLKSQLWPSHVWLRRFAAHNSLRIQQKPAAPGLHSAAFTASPVSTTTTAHQSPFIHRRSEGRQETPVYCLALHGGSRELEEEVLPKQS